MELLLVSFIAGVLTILAPCVVSVLPILLARSGNGSKRSLFAVIVGLSVSIIIFTVLLKATTLFLGIPQQAWQYISGGIIIFFGLVTLFPSIWEWIVLKTRFVFKAQDTLGASSKQKGVFGDILLGASLGPVFSACSPTYALLVAVILPASPALGLLYLAVFVLGLAGMLVLVGLGGQALIKKLGWGINPRGLFRRILGCILIIMGIFIATGLDKVALGYLVESGVYDFQVQIEDSILQE